MRSGSVHAKSTTTADLHEQARSARSFARALTERERRYERAFHAGAFHASPAPDADADAVPYAFYVNEREVTGSLKDLVSELGLSTESALTITCQPLARTPCAKRTSASTS